MEEELRNRYAAEHMENVQKAQLGEQATRTHELEKKSD
jgi:hypothetical protein